MKKSTHRETVKRIILRRPMFTYEIFNMVIHINIDALEDLLNSHDIEKWRLLLENYQSSPEEIAERIDELLVLLKRIRVFGYDDPHTVEILSSMDIRWFNQLRSTLYIMEEDLIVNSQDAVSELWDFFFKIEEDNSSISTILNVREVYEKR